MFKKIVQKYELEGIVAIVCIVILLSSVLAFAVYNQWSIHNEGKIKTVGLTVYEDADLTIPLTNIDWGLLNPLESKNHGCYVKSNSNVPITLNLNVVDWDPIEAENYLTVSWNLENHILNTNEVIEATFTLSVSPSIDITQFAFVTILQGSA